MTCVGCWFEESDCRCGKREGVLKDQDSTATLVQHGNKLVETPDKEIDHGRTETKTGLGTS